MTIRAVHLPAACVALAALSLLLPSSPTYDPWAWIVWGREVVHLDLSTVAGPSWKPLPVLFTAPFSLFGDAAPALWLVVARAGGLAAVALAFLVGRRLGGVVAGVAAAAGLLLAPWFVRNCALGNSEGLMVAAVLAAIDRHLAGRPRQAFACGVAAALLRPEAWPFLGLYALWVLWRERRAALPGVAGGLALVPLLWFPPELWGSGNLHRAADRAQQPLSNSAAFADHPLLRVVSDAAQMLTVVEWAGLGVLTAVLLARRRTRERTAVIAIAALAAAWVLEVGVMTEHGFSGNQRYLIVPVALVTVLAGTGAGWAAAWLPARVPAAVAVAVATAAFGVSAGLHLGRVLDALGYQGELPHRLADVVREAGGADRLKACGRPYTGPFLVPAVAWQLGVHTSRVALRPSAPAVVFRVRTTAGSRPVPALGGLGDAPQRTLARGENWRIVGACG